MFAKVKVITISKAKKKADTAFSIYIRTRDAIKTTGTLETLICVTCDKPYPAFKKGCAQAGHFIPGRHSAVLYDERNAHGQCYMCNIRLKGNPIKYFRYMQKTYGDPVIEELEVLDATNPHYKAFQYLEIEEKFKILTQVLIQKFTLETKTVMVQI